MYVDDDNIFDGRLHAFKETTEPLVVASKKGVLDVNADKKQCMVMSRDRNAERSQNIE